MADPNGVICLGEALIDRLGPLGGDPARDQPVDDRLGGAPANVACGLARPCTAVAFVGRVGGDAIGAEFQRLFVQRALISQLFKKDPLRPTRIVLVRRSQDENAISRVLPVIKGRGLPIRLFNPVALPAAAQWLLVGTIPLATHSPPNHCWKPWHKRDRKPSPWL
jgi:fructokinase